jgi:transposase
MPFLFERMEHMPKQYTPEVKGRAVTYVLDSLDRYKSVYGACQDLAPKLNIGAETLRRWVVQAQIDAGDRTGPTSEELAEIKALKAKVKDLEESNEILRQSAIFFARELDPRRH